MDIHSITEYLGIYSTIAQVFIALAALICFYWTFKLQAGVFEEQQKITKAQIAILEIEIIRHRKEIMPEFSLELCKPSHRYPGTRKDHHLVEVRFRLNANPIEDFRIEVTETANFELYNPLPNPGNYYSNWEFVMQLMFPSIDGTIPYAPGRDSHIIFKTNFKDIKSNEYEQWLYFIPHLPEKAISGTPILKKAKDLALVIS
jgi:hypothetical protein